jgi:hypothetical protein
MFAFTDGTASWSIQPSPLLERKPTLPTRGRFRGKSFRMDGPGDMLKMIKDFSFSNPKQFRDLLQIKTFLFQDFSNLLPQG